MQVSNLIQSLTCNNPPQPPTLLKLNSARPEQSRPKGKKKSKEPIYPPSQTQSTPFGGADLFPSPLCTTAPGCGNSTAIPSGTVHSFVPICATKVRGYSVPRPEPPPVMVTCAQFMYISRLPILLNHVLRGMLMRGIYKCVESNLPREESIATGSCLWNEEAKGAAILDRTRTYPSTQSVLISSSRRKGGGGDIYRSKI